MNEVSNGPSGNMEYVEFVVVDSNVVYSCSGITNPPCIDIRGWIFDDNSGFHGASGVASGCIRFSNNVFWSCIPVGTMILIYNNLDPNSSLPPDDISMSDGNCRIVAPVNNATLFESNATTPGAVACSYPAAGWTASGNWNNTLFANGGDCARIVNLAGCEVFSVCWGTANVSNLIYFAGSAQDRVYSFVNTLNNDPSNNSNWNNGCADPVACGSNMQTPGAPNNPANAAWINSFNNGCAPIPPIAAVGSFTNGGCSPCTASASVSASGSIPPYTYTWSPAPGSGQGTANAGGLCTGSYSCFVESSIGCLDTIIVNVSSGGTFNGTITPTPVTCNGLSNGSATVAVTGGTTPYSYTWSPAPGGGQGTASVTGLSSQIYTVNISDAGGCLTTATTSITQPAILTSTFTTGNISCYNGITNVTVTVGGGVGGYSYTWSPTGGNSSIANNLTAGSYTVLLKDANNCTITAVTNIIQPTALSATVTTSDASCSLANGSATINASGGTPGYAYFWTPSANTSSVATGLAAGNYTVTVTDVFNCTLTTTAVINQPVSFTSTLNVTNVSCNGGANGTASVTISGGLLPYTYSWSPAPGSGQGTSLASGLTAGIYTVMILDANNCGVSVVANVTQPAALTSSIVSNNVSCNGDSNGGATVTATGGTTGYSYNWLPSGGTASVAIGLSAGSYTAVVTDGNSCTVTAITNITEPAVISTSISSTNITCNGAANGSATVTVAGGMPGYTYTWSPSGGNTSIANGLSPNTFTVSIQDLNNCLTTTVVSITQPAALTAIATQTNITCFGANTGSANMQVNGGTVPYTYSWSVAGNTSPNINSLTAGSYTCFISDNNNCTITQSVTLIQPTLLVAGTTNYSICAGMSVSITSSASGGVGPYVFSWNGGSILGQNINVNPISNTVYTLVVTDNNGCNSLPVISSVSVLSQPTVSINGNNSICFGGSSVLSASVIGATSNINYLWTPGSFTTSAITVTPATNVVYIVSVSSTGLCPFNSQNQVTVVVNPNPIVSSNNSGAVGCAPLCVKFTDNSSTSQGTITAWGWNFNNGQGATTATPTICFDAPGTYTGDHTVVNSFGCSSTVKDFVTITVHPKPTADFNHSPIKPIINVDGEVIFTDASWGAPIVNWNWYFMNTAQYTSILQNPTFAYTEAGTYVVALIVKSDKGCTDTLLRPIVVGEDFGLYVPNAFTPNDDGLNDVFQPKGFGIVKYELYIFDRWGEKLFHTKVFEEAWDATYQGRGQVICEEGVYTWLINATDVFGKAHELTGHVTLIK